MYQVIEKLPTMKNKLFGGTTSVSESKKNQTRLGELINSKYTEDLIEAIKILWTFYLQNKDMSVYMSRIINLLPRDDIELKRLCQMLVIEFASEPNARISKTQGDVLLLAISPIFKDLTSFNTSTKLNALKTLPQLRIQEVIPMLMATLKQIAADKNSLVRKVAALSILKMHDLNAQDVEEEEYTDSVNFLLKDTPSTRQTILFVLNKIRPESKMDYVHKRYFQILKDLKQLNQLELERALYLLHTYSRLYFPYDTQHPDLIKLLDSCEQLLKLPYPGVVVAISRIYLDFPQESRLKKITRTLVKFLNIGSESKFIILQVLHRISLYNPALLRDHYRALTILQIEKLYCKLLKLEILHLLIDDHNFNPILEELLYQARSNSPQLVAVAVKLLSKTIIKFPKFLKRTIRSLLEILKSGSSETKNHVIASFCNIISTQESMLPLLAICLQNIEDISDIRYKACVVKLLRMQIESIPSIAAENLRKLTLNFVNQHENVKFEILLLSYQLNKQYCTHHYENYEQLQLLHQYLMTLSQFDNSLLVRDLHRTISQNIEVKDYPVNSDLGNVSIKMDTNTFQIGTLSYLVGLDLPGFAVSEYLNIDAAEQRKIIIPQEIPKQQQQQQQQQSQPKELINQQQETITPPSKQEIKQQQKQIEEDVKKHYQHLDKVLDDFFQD